MHLRIKKNIINIVLILGLQVSFGQDLLRPNTDLQYSVNDINTDYLFESYRDSKHNFTPNELDNLIEQVKVRNRQTDERLSQITREITSIYLDKIELFSIGNITKLESRLNERRDQLAVTRNEMVKSLAQVKFPGIYLVILDLSVDELKSEGVGFFAEKARIAVEPVAIDNILGVQVEKITKIESGVLTESILNLSRTGATVLGSKLYQKYIPFRKKYIYLAKIDIRSTAPDEINKRVDYEKVDAQVFHLTNEHVDFDTDLKEAGLEDKEIKLIKDRINDTDISIEMEVSTFLYDKILETSLPELKTLEYEINDLEQRIENRIEIIRDLCTKYEIPFVRNQLDKVIGDLKIDLNNRIYELEATWMNEKSEELIVDEIKQPIPGSAPLTYSQEVVNIFDQIKKNYSTIHKPFERIEIRNSVIERIDERREKEIYREVNKVWCYPTFDSSGIRILVVAQMKTISASPSVERREISEPEMRFISSGDFVPGRIDQDLDSSSRVHVDEFWIGVYEITQYQWQELMSNNPSNNKKCLQCPVENVSHDDIQIFLERLNEETGLKYRLPTEIEWEFAARSGGKSHLFGDGSSIPDPSRINFDSNFKETEISFDTTRPPIGSTVPVGELKGDNLYGLYDMSGNVMEWCSSNYDRSAGTSDIKVVKGGSWYSSIELATTIYRGGLHREQKNNIIGFRVARDSFN